MEAAYRIDPSDRALLGHSFGGQFALFTLLDHPGFFSRYLVVSPSLWWDCDPDFTLCSGENVLPGVFFEREEEVRRAGTDLDGRLFMAVGLAESPHMVAVARRFASLLATEPYPSLEWTMVVR